MKSLLTNTFWVIIIMIVMLGAPIGASYTGHTIKEAIAGEMALTQEQKEARDKANNALRAARARKVKRDAAKAKALKDNPPPIAIYKNVKTDSNISYFNIGNNTSGTLLSRGGLYILTAKIDDCPEAVAFLGAIVKAGRPVLESDRNTMLVMVAKMDAREAFQEVTK